MLSGSSSFRDDLLNLRNDVSATEEKNKQDELDNARNVRNTIQYKENNEIKDAVLGNLGKLRSKDPMSKLQTYEAIKIETEQLLIREKTLFIINSVVTVGLMITALRIIL